MALLKTAVSALIASACLVGGAAAVEASLQIVLDVPGNAERVVTRYECDGMEPFRVDYVNAAPVFLALLPVEGEALVFVNVVAASGARYVSGPYEWWTRGSEATLTDVTAPEGTAPLACLELTDIP